MPFDQAAFEAYKQRAQAAAATGADPAASAPSAPDRGVIDAFGRGAASGVSAGFYDELMALAEAGGADPKDRAHIHNILKGAVKYWSGNKDAVDKYNEVVAKERALTKTAQEQHPIASTLGEVGGAIAMPLGGGAAAATRGGRLLEGAAMGGAYGALSGAGEGEGAADTINKTFNQGALGVLMGGAAPEVIRGVSKAGSAITDKINTAIGRNPTGDRAAAERILEARGQDANVSMNASGGRAGMSQAEADAARASGAPIIEGDVGGASVRNLARDAANKSSEAQQALEDAVGPRYQSQSKRTSDFLKEHFDYPDSAAMQDRLEEAGRRSTRPVYDAAFNHPKAQGLWSEELQQFSGAPVVQDAIRNAVLKAKNESALSGYAPMKNPFVTQPNGQLGLRPPTKLPDGSEQRHLPNLEFWDAVKRNLDKAGPEGQNAARSLREHLDAITADGLYKKARGTAAEFFGADRAFVMGGNFARMTGLDATKLGEARKAVASLTPANQKLFRQNFVAHLIAAVEKQGDGFDVTKKIANSEFAREQIRVALGDAHAEKLMSHLAVEKAMNLLHTAVSGNSTTARQLSQMTKNTMTGVGSGVAYGVATGDMSPTDMLTAGFIGGLARKGYHGQQLKREEDIAKRVGLLLASDNPNAVKLAATAVSKHPTLRNYFLNLELPAASRGAAASLSVPQNAVSNVGRAEDKPDVPRPRGH
jgi:hypothetical protein